MKSKRMIALLLSAAVLLACAGCGSSGDQKDPKDDPNYIPESTGGKDVVVSKAADRVFSLNSNSKYSVRPTIATNHSNQLICNLVYENMVELDNNFEIIPRAGLITEWRCEEEGRVWTFTVAKGHTFHDGTEVKPADLKYSLENSIFSDRFKGRFASFQGASADDDYLYVTLGIGDTQFVKLLNIPVVKHGTGGDDHPGGSGPYTYNEDFTALVPYEGYAGAESFPTDIIYIKEYTSADKILSAFENSYIDVVLNDPSSYTNLGYASTNEIRTFATTNMHYIGFNEESVFFRFANFRFALYNAFDREYLAEDLLHGSAVAAELPMYPTCSVYPKDMAEDLKYDLEKCVRVFNNTGVRDYDDDGMLEYMNGAAIDIELDFIVCSDSSAKTGCAHRFAQDMESIGIIVNVRELEWEDYLTALEEGDFDMYYAEVKLRNNFDLTEILQAEAPMNFSKSKDPNYEIYINQYLGADELNRQYYFENLCRYIIDNGAIIPLCFEKQQLITHRGAIKGVNPNAGNPLYDFVNWTILYDAEI